MLSLHLTPPPYREESLLYAAITPLRAATQGMTSGHTSMSVTFRGRQ